METRKSTDKVPSVPPFCTTCHAGASLLAESGGAVALGLPALRYQLVTLAYKNSGGFCGAIVVTRQEELRMISLARI